MTRKVLITITIAALLGVAVLAGLVFAADQKAPDQMQILNDKIFGDMKKGPVPLNHAKHAGELKIACADCHHVYKDGKNTWKQGDAVQKCSECHKADKVGNAPKLMNAFHDNCKECHKKADKGPYKKCEDCHAEKK